MQYALIDDSGTIRGLFRRDSGRKHDVESETERLLVPLENDDPRVLAMLNPSKPTAQPSKRELMDAMGNSGKTAALREKYA